MTMYILHYKNKTILTMFEEGCLWLEISSTPLSLFAAAAAPAPAIQEHGAGGPATGRTWTLFRRTGVVGRGVTAAGCVSTVLLLKEL